MAKAKIDPRTRRLLEARRRAVEQAPELTELLRGTVRERFVRCGKAGCHCQDGPGHGPIYYLSVSSGSVGSRQITVAPEDYETAQRYARNYERLWEMLERVSAINRDLIQERRLPHPSARSRSRRTPGKDP